MGNEEMNRMTTMMKIGREEFRDKVYACWMGKNIGGTLGEKWECKRHTHALTFYDPLPSKASANAARPKTSPS